MKTRSVLVLLLFAAGLGAAPPELTLPAEVKGEPGAFVSVPATTTGKVVRWKVVDPGLNLFPVERLKDTHTAVVSSITPGRYRVLAVTALGDEPSEIVQTWVVIGGAPPGPGPDPKPPQSEFARRIAAVLTADPDAALAPKLAEVYTTGAMIAATAPTWGALFRGMADKAQTVGVAGKLGPTQAVIQVRLKTELPWQQASEDAIDASGRAKAKAVFAEVAAALTGK